jgi:hypothetical protein
MSLFYNFLKINTGLQFSLLFITISNHYIDFPSIIIIEPLWYVTGVTTILSGLGYLDGSGLKKLINK